MKSHNALKAMASALLIVLSSSWIGLHARSSTNIVNLANPAIDTTSGMALAYSPNASIQASGMVTVNNGSKTADSVAYCVVFTLTNPGQQGGMSIAVANAATGSVLSLSGAPANASQTLSGYFPSGTSANSNQVYTILATVAPSPIPAPGTYSATIVETLYRGSAYPPSGSAVDTNTLTLTITVGSFYDVSVVPSGSSFSLSSTSQSLAFGALAAGQQLGADILVRTNVSYTLSLSSANKGILANSGDPTSSVAYSLSSNGSSLSLNPGPAVAASGAAATYANSARYAILITISSLASNPSAGAYTDTITVSLASP
jgi:hypothetical protein